MARLLQIAVYAYTLFIAVICLMPMPHISVAPKNSDKVVHVITYVLFTALWFGYFHLFCQKKDKFSPALLKSCGIALIYGIVIEVLQGALTTSRSADFNDLIANCIGILGGVFLIFSAKSHIIWLKSKF